MNVTIVLNEEFKKKLDSDISELNKEKSEKISIQTDTDYIKLLKSKIKLANPKFEKIDVKFVEKPIPFIKQNFLNTGIIIGEDKSQIAYLLISGLKLNSRNILGAQQIFPTLSYIIEKFIKAPMCDLVNLPVYFVNGSMDYINDSMEASIISIRLMGIKYVQMFNSYYKSKKIINNDLREYLKYIRHNNDKPEIVDTDFFSVDFRNKKIVFRKTTFKENNLKNFGSSDRFFVIKAYPALILAFDEDYDIDVSEIQQFLDSKKVGKSNLLPFLEYANKLKKKRENSINDSAQIIYYGAPGTGKSYYVDKMLKNKVDAEHVFRTTFHPEYSYEDFIGQILPIVKNNTITYDFQPGVFTAALKKAYMDFAKPVYLIIEEMTRANVASVFGDIFQLLDRNNIGVSRYPIRNSLIANEIIQIANDTIKLPSNFHIIGTVNSSDQNVFPMDTAFKRRFDWKYISILPVKSEEDNVSEKYEEDNVILNINLGNDNNEVRWHDFYLKLDKFITDRNQGLGLSEDKQIGQFFIKFSKKMSSSTIADKVQNKLMQFLWYDVEGATYESNIKLFNERISNYSDLNRELKHNRQVFSDSFISYYNNMKLED